MTPADGVLWLIICLCLILAAWRTRAAPWRLKSLMTRKQLDMALVEGSVTMNGQTYTARSVQIINGEVIVDGQKVSGDKQPKIEITVYGSVNKLSLGAGQVTAGDVGTIQTGSGDVDCHNVAGSIQTGSGNVTCEAVAGPVSTMSGDIVHR